MGAAGVLAASSSSYTQTLYPIVQSKGLVHGAYAASGTVIETQIVEPGVSSGEGTFFRTCPSDNKMIAAAALLIQMLGWTKVPTTIRCPALPAAFFAVRA